MPEPFSSSVEVRFIDGDAVIAELREAARNARASAPEIERVFLFGSFAKGNWTAESDADLLVVVNHDFPDILSRACYQLHVSSVPTDTVVCTPAEFARLAPQLAPLIELA
jgi:predicted nucleotidyltransferase